MVAPYLWATATTNGKAASDEAEKSVKYSDILYFDFDLHTDLDAHHGLREFPEFRMLFEKIVRHLGTLWLPQWPFRLSSSSRANCSSSRQGKRHPILGC